MLELWVDLSTEKVLCVPWLELYVPIGSLCTEGLPEQTCRNSCFAQSLCELLPAFILAVEHHVGTDPEDADEDAHDRTVICEGRCCRTAVVWGCSVLLRLKTCSSKTTKYHLILCSVVAGSIAKLRQSLAACPRELFQELSVVTRPSPANPLPSSATTAFALPSRDWRNQKTSATWPSPIIKPPLNSSKDRPLSLHASCPGDLRAAGVEVQAAGVGGGKSAVVWQDDLGVVPGTELQSMSPCAH